MSAEQNAWVAASQQQKPSDSGPTQMPAPAPPEAAAPVPQQPQKPPAAADGKTLGTES